MEEEPIKKQLNLDEDKVRRIAAETMERVIATHIERLENIIRANAPQNERWETITKIQKRFGINYYRAKALCETEGVRCNKDSAWPRYNVADCNRVFSGETLTAI